MIRALCLGSRWSSLTNALPRKTPSRWAHFYTIDSKINLLEQFNVYLRRSEGRSHHRDDRVHDLLRQCVSGLRLEHPCERVALADSMWNDLKKRGTKMDVSLHNGLLRVYVSNNHKFSPSQFMEEMSAAGVVPNQSTLNLLLNSHCQHGDLVGAQSILQHIHENGHTVTEQVYANLITGHAQSGNMDEAWKMLDVMEENEFEPGIASYTALLQGHAYHGEIERVRETLQKIVAKKMYPGHDVYIAILDSLSMGGHHSFLNEVLDMFSNKHKLIVPDFLQLVQSWASRGEFESSLQLLETVCRLSSHEKRLQATHVVFHHMILSEQPVNWLFENAMRMTALGCLGNMTWEKVLKRMHESADAAIIIRTLQVMHEQGFNVKTHYLLPAFARCSFDGDLAGLKSCLALLNELNLDISFDVLHYVLRIIEPKESLINIMKESGLVDNAEGKRKFVSILCDHEPFVLQYVLKKIDISEIGEEFLYQCLIGHCRNNLWPNTTALARLFKILYITLPLDELNGCIEKCADTLSQEGHTDAVQSLVTALVDQEYPLSDEVYSCIMSAAAARNSVRQQLSSQDELKEIKSAINKQRHDEVCKLYRSILAKGFRPSIRDCLNGRDCNRIIASLAYEEDIVAAENLLSELQSHGVQISRYTWNSLIGCYSKRGDIENSRKYFELLLSSGQKPNPFTLVVLMRAYSFHGDVNMVQKLLDEDRKKYSLDVSNKMLSCLIQAHLKSDDLAGAVAVYEDSSSSVALHTMLDAIVAEKDHALLERVKERAQSRDSSSHYFDHALMLSYSNSKHLDEAREIASRKGFKINHLFVESFCRSNVSEGKVNGIRSVMQLYDEMGLDTRSLQIHLLKAYITLGDKEGILSIQKEMSELGMRYAAAYLTGDPVVFSEHN